MSFLLLAGGLGLAPRAGMLRQPFGDSPRQRCGEQLSRAICRGGPVRTISASAQAAQTALPGTDIPKYVDPVPTFDGARISAGKIKVSIAEFQQQVLPATIYDALAEPFDRGTYVWAYKVGGAPPHYPGFTIEAQRRLAVRLR